MKYAVLIARFLLGAGFMVFGTNMLFPFLPPPPPVEGSMVGQFMAVAIPSHWMAMVGVFQLLGGALVLLGGTAPLGLAVLAPVLVNILAIHVFLEGGHGIAPGLVFSVLEAFLIYAYREYFRGVFSTSARPKLR